MAKSHRLNNITMPPEYRALIESFKRDLPAILDNKDPHLYPSNLSGWPPTDQILAKILSKTASYFEVNISDLKSRKRDRRLVEPRHIYCLIARRRTSKSLNQIGKLIDRDSTTVHQNAKAIEQRLQKRDTLLDISLFTAVETIEANVYGGSLASVR